MPERLRVLHVDDDHAFTDLVAASLEREVEAVRVVSETSAAAGLERLRTERIDCVVSDYHMPEMNGLAFLEAVRDLDPDLPFVLLTGEGTEEIASRAMERGVTDYFQKGGGPEQYVVLANRLVTTVEGYRSRKALEESERRLSLFADRFPFGVVEWNADSEIVTANAAAEEILGYDRTELVGRTWRAIVPEDSRDGVGEIADALLFDEGGYRSVNENVRGDGERIYCEWYNRVVSDDDGTVESVVSQFQDVTDRIERERELHELTQFREAVVESANVWINVLDETGTVAVWNEAAAEISGYPAADVVGDDSIWELLYPDSSYRREIVDYAEGILRGEAVAEEFETTIRTASGDERILSWYSRAITDEDGEVIGSVAVARDITERRRHERALERRTEQLERQNDRLAEFADLVSHDLRNPLTVAQGHLTLARETCESDHLDAVECAHERMEALIEDILTLAREGDASTNPDPVRLSTLAETSWASVETDGATLTFDGERRFRADESLLKRLFENVFRNAVDHAGPDVTVTVGPLENGFFLEDDGPGIPAAERERIFESGYSTSADGTGLGLAIVRRIADAHGWEVAVAERAGGGTRFEITGADVTS